MSEADAKEESTVDAEGILVRKTLEFDEFPVPAVVFVIRSGRDEPATIRFTDPLPDGITVDNVGLHPNYGEDYLEIEGDHVAFEREMDANETYTAVYGLRDIDVEALEGGPLTPTIEHVEPAAAGDSSDIVREVIEGVDEGDEEEVEPLDLNDPDPDAEGLEADASGSAHDDLEPAVTKAEADGSSTAASDVETDDDVEPAGAGTETDSVAAALLSELRAGTVDDDVRSSLRRHLAAREDSTDARIERLQSDVADLQAYSDALEEFLDENGPGDQLIEDLEAEIDRLEADVQETSDRSTDQADDIDDLQATVDEFADDLDELRDQVDEVLETAGDLDSDAIEDLQEAVDEMEDELSEVAEIQERFQAVFAPGDEDMGDE